MSMVLIAVLAFVAGGLLGYFLLRSGILGHARIVELEQALAASEAERAEYKQQVTAEFTETAEKFRALNRSYEDLHRQLAKSASVLCGEAGAPKLLDPSVAPALQEQLSGATSVETPIGAEAADLTSDGVDAPPISAAGEPKVAGDSASQDAETKTDRFHA